MGSFRKRGNARFSRMATPEEISFAISSFLVQIQPFSEGCPQPATDSDSLTK